MAQGSCVSSTGLCVIPLDREQDCGVIMDRERPKVAVSAPWGCVSHHYIMRGCGRVRAAKTRMIREGGMAQCSFVISTGLCVTSLDYTRMCAPPAQYREWPRVC